MSASRRWHPTEKRILICLSDGRARSHSEIVKLTGLSDEAIWGCLRRLWQKGRILRSQEPLREVHRALKGRAGIRTNLRSYYLYTSRVKKEEEREIHGTKFNHYQRDGKAHGSKSKAGIVLAYLKTNAERAFFSKEIQNALRNQNVKAADVMSNIRRFEQQGLVYVRGYRTNDRQTPFSQGYLLTWLDPTKMREESIADAVRRTDKALDGQAATSPIVHRIHRIRDVIIAAAKTREIVSHAYLSNELICSAYELETAIQRALQL